MTPAEASTMRIDVISWMFARAEPDSDAAESLIDVLTAIDPEERFALLMCAISLGSQMVMIGDDTKQTPRGVL
jgi:hypothetical protein